MTSLSDRAAWKHGSNHSITESTRRGQSDGAAGSRRGEQTFICRNQFGAQLLGQGNVPAVVDGQVGSQLPHPETKWLERVLDCADAANLLYRG